MPPQDQEPGRTPYSAPTTAGWAPAPTPPHHAYGYPPPPPLAYPAASSSSSRWAIGLSIAAIVLSVGAAVAVGVMSLFLLVSGGLFVGGFPDEWVGPQPEGTVPALDALDVGDCFNTTVGRPDTVRAVDCDTPHDGEIYLRDTLEDYPGEYPGTDEIGWAVDERCVVAFDARMGFGDEAWDYTYAFYAPDEESWSQGDRDLACVLMSMRLGSLEGSVPGGDR